MLLDFAVSKQEDFGLVLSDLADLGTVIFNFAMLGDDSSKPKTEALVLLQAPDWEVAQTTNLFLRTSDHIKDPHSSVSVKSQVEIPLGGGTRTR